MKKSTIKAKCDNCEKQICLIPYQVKTFKHHFCDSKCFGEFFSSENNQFFNKTHTAETKKMIGNKTQIWLGKNGHSLKNKHHSTSTRKKMSEAKKGKYLGKDNPNWKGGTSKREFKKAYGVTVSQWDRLTTKIRKRDNYICQYCGERNAIQVHHILPRRIEIDNHPDNLITLCNKCHPKVEKLTYKYLDMNLNPIQIFYEKWSGIEHKN